MTDASQNLKHFFTSFRNLESNNFHFYNYLVIFMSKRSWIIFENLSFSCLGWNKKDQDYPGLNCVNGHPKYLKHKLKTNSIKIDPINFKFSINSKSNQQFPIKLQTLLSDDIKLWLFNKILIFNAIIFSSVLKNRWKVFCEITVYEIYKHTHA